MRLSEIRGTILEKTAQLPWIYNPKEGDRKETWGCNILVASFLGCV